jgi:hypothetical protein
MAESVKRTYLEEKEFLEEFSDLAMVAAGAVDGEWQPNGQCNDATRKYLDHLRSTSELNRLVFNSAAVYGNPNGFSSLQVLLDSSKRVVSAHVKTVAGRLVAEKVLDRSV